MGDELIGKVTWDKDTKWSGTMALADGKTVRFEIDGYEPIESLPDAALNTLQFLVANEPRIRHDIAVAMRKIYGDTWLFEDPITAEELAQKINLDRVSIWDEGGGELLYEPDDDRFTDHSIQVPIDANGEIGEPQLEG